MDISRPKVAIVTSSMDGRPAMGTAMFIRKLIEGLVAFKESLDITLIHREKQPNDPLYGEFREIVIPKINSPKFSQPLSELVFSFRARLKNERFDIYHFAHPHIYPFFFLAPGKKIVTTVYDGGALTAGEDLVHTKDKYGPLKWTLLKTFCNCVIATSQFGKDGLCQRRGFSPQKVAIAYGGAEEIFHPFSEKTSLQSYLAREYGISSPYFIASGRLDPHKNILRLVQAYHLLAEKYHIRLPLIVTGGDHTPEYTTQVHAEIDRLGLRDVIRIWKFPKSEDMPRLYGAAELMIFPSLYEGFGLPLVEAMRCGVSTVAARASSLIEVGGEASEFFDPRNPEDISEAIYRVYSNPSRRQEMIREGLEQAKLFTWERHTRDIADLYCRLAKAS